jgi:molybdopterin-guanine dinucleotide biosynthesis protein B
MIPTLAVIGKSKSGKTTLIEYLISHLAKEGVKIGTVKHVHHSGFSIDIRGKDTWRHSQAGAKVVVCIAPSEIAIIKKTKPPQKGLEKVLDLVKEEKLDLLIVEGFHSLVSRRKDIFKVITAKNEEELKTMLKGTVSPILAIAGPLTRYRDSLPGVEIPLIDAPQEGEKILKLINDIVLLRTETDISH